MEQYIVIHNHQYGFDASFLQTEIPDLDIKVCENFGDNDIAEMVADHLGINFEPEKDEDLTLINIKSINNSDKVFTF